MKSHYKNLLVWQKAVDLVTQVYVVTRSFPREEMFGLTSQIRRCAVSVPSNIAEGQARLTNGEFRQFLGIAKGSLAELDTQLIIAENLGYLKEAGPLFVQISEVGRMISGLLSSLAPSNASSGR
ncbi:MAG: four helix bundle protein [Gemmataceae bacterium]|nr:four helix bundle protein [Gemmataceae bacterium]